jgi:hypothetical protein
MNALNLWLNKRIYVFWTDFGADVEGFGSLVVEVGTPVVIGVGANPHDLFCTRGPENRL